jgi:hypothetical protein
VDDLMAPDVPATNASTEVPFLASAVEWIKPPDSGDPPPDAKTAAEAEPVMDEPDASDLVIAGTVIECLEEETTPQETEPADPAISQETSPEVLRAATDVAALTAAQIMNRPDNVLYAAARLSSQKVALLLA